MRGDDISKAAITKSSCLAFFAIQGPDSEGLAEKDGTNVTSGWGKNSTRWLPQKRSPTS